jgi:hypothetical protein
MTHEIKLNENELKRIVAKHFTGCDPKNVMFSIEEGQFGEKIINARIFETEEI